MEFAAAYAASHAGLIVTRRDQAPTEQIGRIYDGFEVLRREISEARPDAILIIATDHQRAFPLEGVPQFSLGVGPVARGLGDAGIPPCEVPVHQAFAQAILDGCIDRHVDMAFTEDVAIDHSFVVPLNFVTPDLDVPIVPITQNCNVPPRPRPERSHEVGKILGEAVRSGPEGRVVLIGTGGLSHWVGSEERQAFVNRPAGTRIADRDSFPVDLEDTGPINVDWDTAFLGALAEGRVASFIEDWPAERIEKEAGNGAHEIRNWLMAAGAVLDKPAELVAYEPVSEWLTGTGIVRFAV
jgi:hypothetical protein